MPAGGRRRSAGGFGSGGRGRAEAPEAADGPQQPPGDPDALARAISLRLLNQRARSRAELAAALAKRDIPQDAADRVLDRFCEVGLIDDTALAHAMAGAAHRERGLARRAVVAKLRQRGLDGDTVDDAVATIDDSSERVRAEQIVEKRLRALAGLAPAVQQRRLVGLLARKGYPPGVSYDVARRAVNGAGSDDGDDGDGSADPESSAGD